MLGLAAALAGFNLWRHRALGDHSLFMFPLAGFFSPMGLFLLVRGVSTADLARGAVARGTLLAVLAAMVGGALLGLQANAALFGRAL